MCERKLNPENRYGKRMNEVAVLVCVCVCERKLNPENRYGKRMNEVAVLVCVCVCVCERKLNPENRYGKRINYHCAGIEQAVLRAIDTFFYERQYTSEKWLKHHRNGRTDNGDVLGVINLQHKRRKRIILQSKTVIKTNQSLIICKEKLIKRKNVSVGARTFTQPAKDRYQNLSILFLKWKRTYS